jgi:8-oxo-dGTP pyrophosphatase MutT (NUDIX family)
MTKKTEIDITHIRSCLKPLDTLTGLAAQEVPRHGDFELGGDFNQSAGKGAGAQVPAGSKLREAAVLVPLIARDNGYQVLLTQRTAHLNHHAGQVSFPGGRLDPDDADHLAAALRETREEVGLEEHFLDPLGLLDDYETGTNFLVTPVVALVHPGFSLQLEEFEVAEAFEVPLTFIFDEANHQIQSRERDGERRDFYVFEFEERYIWGATAGMLMNLYRRVHGLPGPGSATDDLTTGARSMVTP